MKMCKAILGILVLLAGVELYTNTTIAGLTGLQVAGLLFILFGLGKLAHAFCMCGTCCKDKK